MHQQQDLLEICSELLRSLKNSSISRSYTPPLGGKKRRVCLTPQKRSFGKESGSALASKTRNTFDVGCIDAGTEAKSRLRASAETFPLSRGPDFCCTPPRDFAATSPRLPRDFHATSMRHSRENRCFLWEPSSALFRRFQRFSVFVAVRYFSRMLRSLLENVKFM